MKAPYKWLLEYVDVKPNIKDLGDALTLSGSKVEEVVENGREIQNVVTGKVLEIKKHPDANSLVICKVDVGNEVLQIVTGAKNLTEGDIVPVALHGSSLPRGVKIKRGKLRGVESNGMMCSAYELDVADEHAKDGIMVLPKDTPIAKNIKEVLGLDGGFIDFEITSNRADCFGIYGIARETAATYGVPLKKIRTDYKDGEGNINEHLSVEVKDSLCRRYAAKMVKNIKIQESPVWMQEKLLEAGVRSINNIVDITNYVMLELGQPMHAFDYRDINDKKIIVRKAEDGEKFVTLDEVERTLNSSMLMIADGKRTVAIAGVMGGLNSEIKEDTTAVVFEFANFDGTNIRLTSKKLGLRTEASSKFEKDIDPNVIDLAIARTCNLIEELGAGEVVGGVIDVYPEPVKPHNVEVDCDWICRFLGIDIPEDKIKSILESLEIKVEGEKHLKLTVPTFRQDVKIREDVAEEVVRMYGYDRIPVVAIKGEAVEGAKTPRQKAIDTMKDILTASGLYEGMAYSFVSPKVFDSINIPQDSKLRNVVKILNPLGEDFSVMRTTAIPAMMESLGRNYARDNKEVGLFEISKVYIPTNDVLPDEREKITAGIYGKVDFYDMKGIVEAVLKAMGVEKAEFVPETDNPVFHPGRTARLLIRKKDAGVLGEIHPDVAEKYGLDTKVYVCEIDIDTIIGASKLDKKYKHLPKYPAVTRDIAMLVKDSVTVGEIEHIINKAGKELLEEVKLFDVYKGKQVPEGFKSVAYSLIYRKEDKTLTDEEVSVVHNNILKMLSEKLNAELRQQ